MGSSNRPRPIPLLPSPFLKREELGGSGCFISVELGSASAQEGRIPSRCRPFGFALPPPAHVTPLRIGRQGSGTKLWPCANVWRWDGALGPPVGPESAMQLTVHSGHGLCRAIVQEPDKALDRPGGDDEREVAYA